MNYEETVEFEENVKIKEEADKICRDFKANVKLEMKNYKGNGIFVLWSDSHNKILVDVSGANPSFQCRFLHEEYDVLVRPSSVFSAIKAKYRGVAHLKVHSRKPT